MKKSIDSMQKRNYIQPGIEIIKLDNEISLSLDSTPAPGPGEGLGFKLGCAPEHFNNDPFKTNQA